MCLPGSTVKKCSNLAEKSNLSLSRNQVTSLASAGGRRSSHGLERGWLACLLKAIERDKLMSVSCLA